MEIVMRKTSEIQPYDKNPRDNDGAVDVVDLGILAKNYDWVSPSGQVPEPICLSLMAIGAAALLRRRG